MANFFISLLSQSADIILLSLKLKMQDFVATTVRDNCTSAQQDGNDDDTSSEDVLWPFMSLAYMPGDLTDVCYSKSHNCCMKNLKDLCLQLGLLLVHNVVLKKRQEAMDVITEDGLIDFVTCLPWYTELRKDKLAIFLEAICHKDSVEVPLLLNMCKAKLARIWFGLEMVLTRSVQDIVIEWTRLK